jgi:hypothetical protein
MIGSVIRVDSNGRTSLDVHTYIPGFKPNEIKDSNISIFSFVI